MTVDTAPAMTSEELAEIALRNDLISMHRRTADLLESEKNLYLRHVLESKGLDPTKQYIIDPDTKGLREASDG